MKSIREAIDKRLNFINFDELHQGFKEYDYALYDDEYVYLKDKVIKKDQKFIGNTAIEYEGSYLAIWYKPEGDMDILTSDIVHEMFHCYQYDSKIPIHIDDINATRFELNKEYLELKQLEKQCLVVAIKTLSETAYSKVLSIREKRKAMNPVYHYELTIETFEGTAESCKLNALMSLNKATYDKVIIEGTSYLLEEHFDTRRLAYFTGAYMNLLHVLYPETQADKVYDITPVSDLEKVMLSYRDNKASQFEGYRTSEKLKGRICGYDPMNMIGHSKQILHKHFVMICKDGENEFYKGPIITVYNDDAFEVVEIRKLK